MPLRNLTHPQLTLQHKIAANEGALAQRKRLQLIHIYSSHLHSTLTPQPKRGRSEAEIAYLNRFR